MPNEISQVYLMKDPIIKGKGMNYLSTFELDRYQPEMREAFEQLQHKFDRLPEILIEK